jgi:hypothetical protein
MQLSGEDDEGNAILSVVVKRTYRLAVRSDGETADCLLADEQLPLHTLVVDEADPEIVVQEADIYPCKPLSDVVVRGHAYPPGKAAQFRAAVSVGTITKSLEIVGDRRCTQSATGQIVFGEPAPFEKMPLRYDLAYGGIDRVAEGKFGNPYATIIPYLSPDLQGSRHSPYRYPRNGVGRGYVIEATPEALEALDLPNLEDPTDRLSPERLAVGSTRRWPSMPLPWGTDWLSLACFPRIGFLGGTPSYEPFQGEFPEVRRGFMPAGYPRRGSQQEMWHGSARNAGSLGLQLGPFTPENIGSIEFRLENLHPRQQSLSFRLPEGGPKISVDGRSGKLVATAPVLHHVVIEPDLDQLSVVWRGAAPALRRYMLEELLEMPLLVAW